MERVRAQVSAPGDPQRQPVGFSTGPAPLSGELDEIVEYMRFIGERRTTGRG